MITDVKKPMSNDLFDIHNILKLIIIDIHYSILSKLNLSVVINQLFK